MCLVTLYCTYTVPSFALFDSVLFSSLDPQFCLNATELPPLLVPPPPKVLAVKGQTVKVTATYKGDYSKYFLQAFWIVKNPDSMYILPGDNVSG